MTCARTGWRVDIRARVMNRASRSFNFRNVLRFIKAVSLAGPARGSLHGFARAHTLQESDRQYANAAAEASRRADGGGRGAERSKGSDHSGGQNPSRSFP